ncbi:MAG: hypothetical protein HY360_24390 [Verrucomicrobia bacterium]|nr:hypothetical protein [Verrucomicrobiota bacterium]
MKISQQKIYRLEAALAEKLRTLLGEVEGITNCKIQRAVSPNFPFDFVASVSLPGSQKARLYVDCKIEPRPSLFPVLVAKPLPKRSGNKPQIRVLAAPFVSPRMADLCKQNGWSWFDLAGNCRLNIAGAIHIERTGFAPVHKPAPPRANLSTPHAARVIRVLLAPENMDAAWTQSSLMEHIASHLPHAPVSIGLVNKITRHLKDEAFIEETKDGKFRLRDPMVLLAAWRSAYRFDRHIRRNYFTLLQGGQLHDALTGLESITGGHAAYMGFSATSYVKHHRMWLYLGSEYEKDFQNAAKAKLVESGENVVVFLPDDPGVFYGQEGEEGRLPITSPAQTYVDLFHCGGRGDDAAEALLNHKLKPEWKLRGLLHES